MRIRVGCEFQYDALGTTPTVWQVRPRADSAQRLASEAWDTTPPVPRTSYHDAYGNICDRLTLPPGQTLLRYDAQVEVPGVFDDADKNARQVPVESLPDEAMVFLLPSRFCLSDVLRDRAWQLFGATEPGWPRVAAVCDWVHDNVQFQIGSSNPLTSALDVWDSRIGVCRDFAHLGLTLCRSLNIPARYVFGYLPDIGVAPPYAPMDFCAWFEAYLDNRWWTFDPRNNEPRIGRVVIGRGRDALDVAMVTSYGAPILQSMLVWADEVADSLRAARRKERRKGSAVLTFTAQQPPRTKENPVAISTTIPDIQHVAMTVTDLDAARPGTRRSSASTRPRRGHRPVPPHRLRFGNTMLGLHGFPDLVSNERFNERRPGLDHISFGCANRGELEKWAARLDELGVAHGDIVDAGYGSGLSFRDPDNIALELFAPPA